MKHTITLAILLFSTFLCAAQEYTVQLEPDKKVIHIEKLGLPDNTPLLEVLRMIPELVVREGDEFLQGYDLFLDDKSLGYNKDVVLSTLKIWEVEKIEISTSATASQQINGMAGTIKIVSRSMPEGLSGNLSANFNTLWDVYPNMNLNYRTNKLELRGTLGLDYYSGNSTNLFEKEFPKQSETGTGTIKEKSFQETARLYLKYNPTKKDQLKFWVLESYGLDNIDAFTSSIKTERLPDMGESIYRITEESGKENSKASNLNFGAFAEYEHLFREDMKFVISADYIRDNKKEGSGTLNGVSPERPQVLRSEVKLELPFLFGGNRKLIAKFGGNTEYDIQDKIKTESRSLYASPFIELNYVSRKWKINGGIRYQYYDLTLDKSKQGLFTKGSHDVTFNVNTLWQIVDHQALRLVVTKNIIRPPFDYIYPEVEWDFKRKRYVKGNGDLLPATMYSFDFDYISDWKIGDHSFVANASLGYDRVDGLVNTVNKETGVLSYITYTNSGVNDIFKAKANLLYKYGIFSVSLAGNWYHNVKKNEGITDNVDNFNIALSPIFSFRKNWILSGTFRYNNALISRDSRLGECFYSYLRISKTTGKWTFSAALSDIFGYASENYEYKDGGYYYTLYDQYPRCIEFGVTYRI